MWSLTIFRSHESLKEGSLKIENFMTPEAAFPVIGLGHTSHKVKMNCFFKNLLYFGACFRQTKCIVMMTMEGSTKILIS